MSTPRSREKSKRLLPNVPFTPRQEGGKNTININNKAQVGPEKVEKNERSTAKSGSTKTSSSSKHNTAVTLKQKDTSKHSMEQKAGVVQNKEIHSNCESDKENLDESPRKVTFTVNTPVKPESPSQVNSYVCNGATNYNMLSSEGMYNNLHFDSPSPNIKGFLQKNLRRHTMDEKVFSTPECYKYVQFDKPYYEFGESNRTDDGEDSCSVTVAVRVRPFSARELADPNINNVVYMNGNETKVKTDQGTEHQFLYDFSFSSFDINDPEYVSQNQVYQTLAQPLLTKAFEGYNTCLFAYGQTGSGKSYCIMGHGEDRGIIPRFCEELFYRTDSSHMNKVKIHVEISFFEIYNEKIHDLLASSNNKTKKTKKATLRVREHPVLGPYVEGLSTFVVTSFEDVNGWITLGNKNRATAATGMNDKSSRSHSVFTIVLTQTKTEVLEGQEHDHSITSKINLVDLAGSERQSLAQTSGERLREGANINKSLLTLGIVISQLAEQSSQTNRRKKIFIPYRDSVLTWLLKESLGGNSKTAMIATVSPANLHVEETLSTLRYAQTARSIVNIARVNEDPKAKLIRELRNEIDRLRASGMSGNDDVTAACMVEIATLKEKLEEKEREMEEITKSWQERLRQSEERKQQEAKSLEKAGVTLKVDNRLPNLVNLNEDPQISEMLLYNIKEGTTKVGRMGCNSKHDIQLNGALIADNHCVICNVETIVTISPIADAPTYVNGNLISEPTTLHHGDRVILGGDHYFRFNHPIEVQHSKKSRANGCITEIKDFEFAKAEVMQVQEARLQQARQAAQEEMLEEVEELKREAEIKLAGLEKNLREKAEGKVKEAEDVILSLKKQKLMLEQEVLAGRKRQQLEAEAAQKASSVISIERSRLLELLQEHTEEQSRQLENLRQRRKVASRIVKEPNSNHVVEPSSGKMDLYKIALQIREANKIAQLMKKHTVFSREDYLDGEEMKTVVKVTNTKLNVCTHWSLNKFEEKLAQMRDIFQTEDDDCEEDEVFNDPADTWGKDNTCPSPISPKRGELRSVLSPSLRQALLSSVSSVNSSLNRQDSCTDKAGDISSLTMPSVASLCKDTMNFTLCAIKASPTVESVADQVLYSCHLLNSCVSQTVHISQAMESNNKASQFDALQLTCVQMTTAFHSLQSATSLYPSIYQSLQSPLIQDLLHRLSDQVRFIAGHIVRFLQGCEGSIESLMEESVRKMLDCIHCVCKLAGELALVNDTHVIYLDHTANHAVQISGGVCQSFLCGCELFIDKTLQGALRTVEDLETRAQQLTDNTRHSKQPVDVIQNTEICVSCCKDLLSKCQRIQVDSETIEGEKPANRSPSFVTNYRRCQALLSHVSDLVDSMKMFLQHIEPVALGRECDVRKVIQLAELVRKYAVSVADVSGCDGSDRTGQHRNSSSSSTHNSSQPSMSDSRTDILQFAANDIQTAIDELIDSVHKDCSQSIACGTPRGKRLLPSQPLKKTS